MTTIATKTVPLKHCRLNGQDVVQFELLAADGETSPSVKRQWNMVANSGAIMGRWWGRMVLDLDGAKYKQKLALLMDHWTDRRLGYSTKIARTSRGLEASGKLLDNELATQVLKESAEGFPFEASLMAVPTRIQEIDEGEEATVNGQTLTGPMTIFREWTLRELTLTVLGADANTQTEAFADVGEIEVEMTTKLKNAPASEPEKTPPVAVQPAAPAPETLATAAAAAPAPAPAPAPNPTEVERKRAAAILAAADPCQTALAQELVTSGAELADALQKLNADLKTRLGAAQVKLRAGTEPMGAGNTSGHDGTGAQGLGDADQDPEKAWKCYPQLREEFRMHGESETDAKARFEAERRFAAKYLPGGDKLVVAGPRGERFAAETHLAPLTVRGIRGDFYLGLETREDSWVNDLATVYTTDQPQEDYPFLGMVPRLRKWEGPRAVNELNRGRLTIVNDDYEDTISIDGKDWRRDKSKQMSLRVQEMGDAAAELPLDLLSTILNTGHTTSLAWDGVALFGTHAWGEASVDNDLGTGDGLAGGAAPTAAQMANNIFLAIMRLLSFKDDRGRPFNTRAKSFKVMIPPNMLAATEAALADMFTAAGVSNTLATAVAKGTLKISYYWNPRLTATDTFFVWRDDARVKPLIYQEEFVKTPYLLAEGSEHFQRTNKVEVGAHMAGGAAPGKYELIVRAKCA